MSIWIAGPGRFQTDFTFLKSNGESWYDLFGNVAEYTGDFATPSYDFCDYSVAPAAGATTCTRARRGGDASAWRGGGGCPAGTYGANTGLTSAACSGLCQAGN
jgi:formylglycine-generating enzyme required for sulfatase activity